jgi:hypothetical protein
MFDYKHYVPIVRWKAGERTALRELYDDDKADLTPLIEIPADNIEKALNKKISLAEFASQVRVQILECWGRRPAFVDLSNLTARVDSNGRNAFTQHFHRQANSIRLALVPVIGLGRASVARVHSGTTGLKNDMCLRLNRGDLQSEELARHISAWISNHEAHPSKVHLVLDLGTIDQKDQGYLGLYSNIPLLDQWKTVTIAGGSFPKDLQELSVGEHLLPRTEWDYWKQLARARLLRIPTFGDYASLHPFLQPPFPGMNPSASIRYTSDDAWVVMRGEGLRNEGGAGYAQYPANAQSLMARPEFCGRDFSFGDNYIYERPLNKDNPGNTQNWVTAGVNHHLTFVVRQIASLFELPTRARRYTQLDIGIPIITDATENGRRPSGRSPNLPPKKPS